jgi:hypothetical protein
MRIDPLKPGWRPQWFGIKQYAQQSSWKAVHRRDHDSFKRDIIFRIRKQFVSSVRPIQGM